MSAEEIDRLACAWVKLHKAPEGSGEYDEHLWSFGKLWDFGFSEPDLTWLIIQKILEKDSTNAILGTLSAGPLEDLLVRHGPAFIERIEREAATNPIFRRLLGGVWKSDMNDDIWQRVQKSWDRHGWDSIPE